jgi:hypothetical protein
MGYYFLNKCCYNHCHGNAVKGFRALRDNIYDCMINTCIPFFDGKFTNTDRNALYERRISDQNRRQPRVERYALRKHVKPSTMVLRGTSSRIASIKTAQKWVGLRRGGTGECCLQTHGIQHLESPPLPHHVSL